VGVQRVVLEDHRDVPVARVEPVHDAVADPHLALGDVLEPGDHPQRRRLAAAGGADEDHELPVGHLEAEAGERARAVVIDLADVRERDRGHQRTAPAVIPRTM
jgi:hypothetical protein